MRFTLVNNTTGIVENTVEIETGDGSVALEGYSHIQSDTAGIGDTWNGSTFVRPPE